MEFNQENRTFSTTVTVLDTVAEQLADVDLTLPDYCPDIEKILKWQATHLMPLLQFVRRRILFFNRSLYIFNSIIIQPLLSLPASGTLCIA